MVGKHRSFKHKLSETKKYCCDKSTFQEFVRQTDKLVTKQLVFFRAKTASFFHQLRPFMLCHLIVMENNFDKKGCYVKC